MFATALEPAEIITKISFPLPKKAAYQKFRNQASRFALVGVFVGKRGSEIRVAVTGAGANGVFRVPAFEEALKKRFSPKSLEGLTISGRRHEQRHPRQRRIPRPSRRRAGAAGASRRSGLATLRHPRGASISRAVPGQCRIIRFAADRHGRGAATNPAR